MYVSNGSGSGSWTTVSNSVLATEAKAFQSGLLHILDQQTAGTGPETYTSGAWRTSRLNTVQTNQITSSSLSSNQISLPAGTYFLDASKAILDSGRHSSVRFRNITDSSTTLVGLRQMAGNAGGANVCHHLRVRGQFTIAGTKVFELQVRTETNVSALTGWNSGEVDVFADVCIWKIG